MTVEASHRRVAAVRARIGVLVAVAALLATAIGAGLVVALGGDGLAQLGLPDSGLLTRAGLPAVRVLSECAGVVTVGSLLLAAFLVPPQASGYLDTGGYAAVRTARIAALVWALCSALMVPLLGAQALGRPVTEVLNPLLLGSLVSELSQPGAWALTAGIALVLAGFCWIALSWGAVVWLSMLSIVGLMPVALTGHSSAGGAHDVATSSLLYHLVAAALWVGGLIALLAHLARRGDHAGLATQRFSKLALVCWIVMAASGVINALIRVTPDQLLSAYGLLVLGKVTALLALGVVGWLHRRSAVAAVVDRSDRSAILRLGGVEVLIMFATIGIAVALSQTAPPGGVAAQPSRTEVLLGYDLSGPPTLARLLLEWRLDLVFGVAALALAGAYLAGVRRLQLRGDAWPVGRTVAWLTGCATVLIATSSGIGRYSMAMFSVHMGVHMLLSMLAPILLVLGGPVTLALRALPPAGKGNPPGPREWLQAFTHSWIVRMSTHPLMALSMYIASFYVMYFTGLYDAAAPSHWAHLVMNAHFLLMGYVYYWLIVGIDPAPRRLPYLGKLGLLVAAMPFHAFFGISLMGSDTVIGGDFYRVLALPFVPDLLADQRVAGAMAWSLGEIPMVVVLVALLVQWARSDAREARRFDRRAESDGETELVAYNALLAQLAERPPARDNR
ncbi:MAG: bifunctional copper resistance protein CopD/cytochrome c oxidase assembly protein [Actinomycetota bacterium]|nr:bifunctional copper resistance protein CopD/cytochrome c oxidase assembly protein [Actinomycetota bacterium]